MLRDVIRLMLEEVRPAANVRTSIYTRIKLLGKALRYRGFDVEVEYDAPRHVIIMFDPDVDFEAAQEEVRRSSSEIGLTKYFEHYSEDMSGDRPAIILRDTQGAMDLDGDMVPDYEEIGLADQMF